MPQDLFLATPPTFTNTQLAWAESSAAAHIWTYHFKPWVWAYYGVNALIYAELAWRSRQRHFNF